MHLNMAGQLAEVLEGRLATLLDTSWPDFLIGSIAPDYQVICDIPREKTHFYPIPPAPGDYNAFGRLLAAYPALADPAALSPGQAIFTVSYGIHLLFDLLWDHRVLTPHFRHADWGDIRTRFTAHNTLLTFLDREALAALPPGTLSDLARAATDGRLPFAEDGQLARWQTLIVDQLAPGAAVQTVEIYAGRMGISADQFAGQLNDPTWMADHVFRHVSLDAVRGTLEEIIPLALATAGNYLEPLLAQARC